MCTLRKFSIIIEQQSCSAASLHLSCMTILLAVLLLLIQHIHVLSNMLSLPSPLKIDKLTIFLQSVAEIARTQPYIAYVAYTHCVMSKWNFLMRILPGIYDLLQPLKETIAMKLIPAIVGHSTISDLESEYHFQPTTEVLGCPIQLNKQILNYGLIATLIIQQHQDVLEGHQSKMKYEIHKQRKQQDKES